MAGSVGSGTEGVGAELPRLSALERPGDPYPPAKKGCSVRFDTSIRWQVAALRPLAHR